MYLLLEKNGSSPGSGVSGIMGSLEELLNKSVGMDLFRQGGVGKTWH